MPASYRPPLVADDNDRTHSQSVETALRPPSGTTTVRDILADKGGQVHSLAPGFSVAEAAEKLGELRIGAILVMRDGAIVGILSERDIVGRLGDEGTAVLQRRVEEIMTPDPVTCHPDDALLFIMHRMTEGRFRHMPVIDNGALVGLVSIGDLVNYRLRELEYDALRMKQMIVG